MRKKEREREGDSSGLLICGAVGSSSSLVRINERDDNMGLDLVQRFVFFPPLGKKIRC